MIKAFKNYQKQKKKLAEKIDALLDKESIWKKLMKKVRMKINK